MPKKIAELVQASIYNQKGLFMAVHNRILHLNNMPDYSIDSFIISSYKSRWINFILRQKNIEKPKEYSKDNVKYNVLWYKNSLIDYILFHKLKLKTIFFEKFENEIVPLFKDYDLINTHSGTGQLALKIKKKYGIPYVVTWHGSDIHTIPFNNKSEFERTKDIMENAECNFFVSDALRKLSEKITTKGKKEVLYNGINDKFYKYSLEEKQYLKQKYGVEGLKVVAFIGSLLPVKNIGALIDIFSKIYASYKNIEFWVIGDGPLRKILVENTKSLPIRFWGDVESDKMPELLNSIDLVVLPSKNEGLPLVCVESIGCGVNIVASNVGGISEVVGAQNVFDLDNDFVDKISERALYLLSSVNNNPVLDKKFNWDIIAEKEKGIIDSILNKTQL